MYQRIGLAAYKADLSNTLALADYLGNPERDFPSIHVAGTNGKGSTSHMLASVLQEQGYKVGLYTSPHLKDFRERIKINGSMIPESDVMNFVSEHKDFFEERGLSFFEMTVGMAFDHFSKEEVDIAVIEVGLGGRLDSTNIVRPEVAVITNIGLDHTRFLGNTLESIAREKAGIIKSSIPVVIGEIQKETRPIFEDLADKNNAPIVFAEEMDLQLYPTDLKGKYQEFNQRTALASLTVLVENGWKVDQNSIKVGMMKVTSNTGLMGRWQILNKSPKVICDTSHNYEGLRIVMEQLKEEPGGRRHIVLGSVTDKDVSKILSLFPKDASYYFCSPDVLRGLDAKLLRTAAARIGLKGRTYPSVKAAYNAALNATKNDDIVFVGGSTFVVAEVL